MDVVQLRIPLDFVRKRARIGWCDIKFGLANHLLDPQAPSIFAVDQVRELEEPPPAILELAESGEDGRTMELVELAAEGEKDCDPKLRDKWLYIVLAWLYEQRHVDSDPLQRVEEVYADFGYPSRIAGFVRYMPMVGADLGSKEANEQRMLNRWKQYLDEVGPAHLPVQ